MNNSFSVGDRVKFKEFSDGKYVPSDFDTDFIGVKHGSTVPKENIGTVTKIMSGRLKPYAVEYIDEYGKAVCLAFSGSVLEFAGKARKPKPPKFILQYELDDDPFELFSSMAEVKARIEKLAGDRSLKRDSLVVYEIANIRKVTLGVSISLASVPKEASEEVSDAELDAAVAAVRKTYGKLGKKRCPGCKRFFMARGLRRHQASCWRYKRS